MLYALQFYTEKVSYKKSSTKPWEEGGKKCSWKTFYDSYHGGRKDATKRLYMQVGDVRSLALILALEKHIGD